MHRTPRRLSHQLPPAPGAMRFTLIELLVVVAIIGILAALLLPALMQANALGTGARYVNTGADKFWY